MNAVAADSCPESPTGLHDELLSDLVVTRRGGMAKVRECQWCGQKVQETSAADERARPPL